MPGGWRERIFSTKVMRVRGGKFSGNQIQCFSAHKSINYSEKLDCEETQRSTHLAFFQDTGSSLLSSIYHFFNVGFLLLTPCIPMPNFPGGSEVKASASNAGDPGLIPVLGRSPGEGNGNPLQYSCLENPMNGGAW